MSRKHDIKYTEHYSECVRQARMQSGLSKRQFARKLGVSRFFLRIMERKQTPFRPKQLIKHILGKVKD